MKKFILFGDFSYDTSDLGSMKGFSLMLRITSSGITHDQHVYIKQKIEETLGVQSYAIPQPWGDNPPDYNELNFDVKDPELCKHIIGLLKQGNVELKAAGRPYPPNSDHPLFATLDVPKELPLCLVDFSSLNTFIDKTLSDNCTLRCKTGVYQSGNSLFKRSP